MDTSSKLFQEHLLKEMIHAETEVLYMGRTFLTDAEDLRDKAEAAGMHAYILLHNTSDKVGHVIEISLEEVPF